jgi:4'-phosphopantetheinyl transferase
MIAIESMTLRWPLRIPALRGRLVHVWKADLSVLEERYERLEALLSTEERQRALGYLLPGHRRRFRMVRGALRELLGAYLQRDPIGIELSRGDEGKPMLTAGLGTTLHFNISHSRGLALLSFCEQAQVGVDVEYLDATVDTDVVANTAFSQSEQARYRGDGTEQRLCTFFRIWTQKEARIKAHGLAMAHRYFPSAEQLPVVDLPLGAQYVGAVALWDPHIGARQTDPYRSNE